MNCLYTLEINPLSAASFGTIFSRTFFFTTLMETLKKKKTEYPKKCWERKIKLEESIFQTIPQSYTHQDSRVLAQKQKYRSMEQARKPRDKLTQLWAPYLWQRKQEYTMGQQQQQQQNPASLISGAGKIG